MDSNEYSGSVPRFQKSEVGGQSLRMNDSGFLSIEPSILPADCELGDVYQIISSLPLIFGTNYADYTVFGFLVVALKFRHLNY